MLLDTVPFLTYSYTSTPIRYSMFYIMQLFSYGYDLHAWVIYRGLSLSIYRSSQLKPLQSGNQQWRRTEEVSTRSDLVFAVTGGIKEILARILCEAGIGHVYVVLFSDCIMFGTSVFRGWPLTGLSFALVGSIDNCQFESESSQKDQTRQKQMTWNKC